MGGDHQAVCLADRLLTGLSQPQTNPQAQKGREKVYVLGTLAPPQLASPHGHLEIRLCTAMVSVIIGGWPRPGSSRRAKQAG